MKQMKQWLMVAAVVALCGTMTGCKGNAQRPVNGTMEEAVAPGEAPKAVVDLMKHVNLDDRYETLIEDKTTGVAVYSLLNCGDTVSSEGYGMVVAKGDVKTALPQLRHGRMPRARYDAATGDLWILGSDTEGTGVNVERPYLLRFGDDGYASIVNSIDPYQMQEAMRKVLTYSIKDQEITFYCEGKEIAKATNTMEDMGGFMDDAIYIGEQIYYSIEGPLTVHVTPGMNFVVGKVLQYEGMPTISATVTLDEKGNITLSNFEAVKEP
ncbi:MAG: hypothetical protein IKW85_11980 [Muribaculaceae bacterium]|nr:hypothetical protein [Muribaculaceae bacterium]